MQTLPSTAQVDRALDEVYRQPEFIEPVRKPDIWGWIGDQIGKAFAKIFEWLSGFRGMQEAAPFVFWIVVALLSATAIALLGHLIYSSTDAFSGGRGRASADDAPLGRGPRTAADWEADARRAAGEGRLRDAALSLYQALVLRLDARGALRFDPAKTPGDYRREVRANPEVARPFTTFLRGFEPVAFGGRALDADGYERLRSAAGEAGARG